MAACHIENTSCYLSGSAPCRQGLEQILMSVVSEKGLFTGFTVPHVVRLFVCYLTPLCFPVRCVEEIERPLAQSLEGWVLQQAVTGLMLEGKLDQAEALCTQVRYKHRHTLCLLSSSLTFTPYCCIHIPILVLGAECVP